VALYRRRVQKIGKATFIITLPVSWAREVGLEPRSEVFLEVLPDMSLRVYTSVRRTDRDIETLITIDERYNEHDVAREIIAYYIAGTSMIKLLYSGVSRSIVDRGIDIARDRLIGLEVIDEDVDTITLQIVVDPNLSDIESVVKRLKRIAISMHRDIILYMMKDIDSSILESVISRDNLADKLYLLALRQLTQILRDPHEMSKRGIDHIEAVHRVMFIKSLERVADHAVNIAKTVKLVNSIPKDIVELYKETIEVFDLMSDAFIAMDKLKAIELVKRVEKLKVTDEEIRKKIVMDKSLDPYLTRLLDTISRIVARTIDTEEIVIDISSIKLLKT